MDAELATDTYFTSRALSLPPLPWKKLCKTFESNGHSDKDDEEDNNIEEKVDHGENANIAFVSLFSEEIGWLRSAIATPGDYDSRR